METLQSRDQRHPWLKYQAEGYTKDIVHSYKKRLEVIFGRLVNRVHVLYFDGLAEKMRQTLAGRLRMIYTGDEGQELFTSHALTYRQRDGRGSAYWMRSERVIPDKGDLRDYWIEISSDRDFLGPAPFYIYIRDPVRRLCHRMISCSIFGKGQAPEKVTGIDLFYLKSMDRGTKNVPYLLAQYLLRHAEGRKSEVKLFRGHFIGRFAASGPERQPDDVAGALESVGDAPAVDVGALANPTPMEAPYPLHASPILCLKGLQGTRRRCMSYGEALWDCIEMLIDQPLIRVGSQPG
nr:hypothetical protein [Tanacetum cinerariifolium]